MSDLEQLSDTTESAATEAAEPSHSPQDYNADEASADEATGQPSEPESDEEEAEINGEKYRVPKALAAHLQELKNGYERVSDYTKKTQAVAEERKGLEARAAQMAAREQFQQQHITAVAKVISIDEQLAKFQALDWNGITDADPVQAMKLERQMRELQQQRTQIVGDIEQKQKQQELTQQQASARQRYEAQEQLQRDIKGWGTPEVEKALVETGLKNGYTPTELAGVGDPRAIKLLHKAYLYDQLVAKQAAEAKPKPAEVKPITRVNPGGGTVKKSIYDPNTSMEDFFKLRNEAKKRR